MISTITDAERLIASLLNQRGVTIESIESRVKPGNSRLFTNKGEVYHVKFTKVPFRPDADKQGAARELHLKLQFAMKTFEYRSADVLQPEERGTMVGIDEDLLLALCQLASGGKQAYVTTVLEREVVLWISADEFYNFVMRYDTFMKFPRSGVPVCYAPTGYFLTWSGPKAAVPTFEGI